MDPKGTHVRREDRLRGPPQLVLLVSKRTAGGKRQEKWQTELQTDTFVASWVDHGSGGWRISEGSADCKLCYWGAAK